MSAAIEAVGLRKRYGDEEAVAGIDLDIAPGEVFCLLGPNGAGKTTTVEILEGYRDRTAGTALVLGLDPAGQPVELRRRIGIVLQDTALPGELRVRELLDAYSRYYPSPAPVSELLQVAELEGEAGRLVRRLSGGQRRRLDLALALVGRPELLFLDEPTTGFDPLSRRRSWEVVRGLAETGMTVVLTTHYLDEAEQLADRIAVVVDGRIVACDTPARLGGRQEAPAVVSFERDPRVAPPELGCPLVLDGHQVRIETADVDGVLRHLLTWSEGLGQPLRNLSVVRRSLEDTYVELLQSPVHR